MGPDIVFFRLSGDCDGSDDVGGEVGVVGEVALDVFG